MKTTNNINNKNHTNNNENNKIICDHCRLPYGKNVMIEDKSFGEAKFFCCKGCQGIYHLLKSEGLDSFYDKLGQTQLQAPIENNNKTLSKDLEKFDLDGFRKKYVKTNSDGFSEIYLIIEGIHCSACVWLNEKVLNKEKGVLEASINYTNNKAKIVFEPSEIKISDIIEKIRSIGYEAYPYDPARQEEQSQKIKKDYYSRLLVAIFASMNIMWIAVAQYTGYFTGMRGDIKNVLNIFEWILATPTLFYVGWVYFRGAYFGLKNRLINMDLLVCSGSSLAYLYSVYAMISQQGEVYFDSVVMIITFVFVGKYLEVLSKKKAVDVLDKLNSSIPSEVLVIKNGEKIFVPTEEVCIGDEIEIKAGDSVAIDGIIVFGEGGFDLSSLSGESKPIFKKVGDEILSGCALYDNIIRYRATKTFADSAISSIVLLLEDSISKKPKIELLANMISGYFSLVVLVLGVLTFTWWQYFGGDFQKSIMIFISVIVIACPCALGLATPVATLVALSRLAKQGIVFKEAACIEALSRCDVVVLDKTGTITKGKPEVVNFKQIEDFDPFILYLLVKNSNHPISAAIEKYILQNFNFPEDVASNNNNKILDKFWTIQARGLKAIIGEIEILGGNFEFIKDEKIDFDIQTKGENSIFIYAYGGRVKGVFELQDEVKIGVKEAVKELGEMGLEVIMLTGDNENAALNIAKKVGIDKFYHSLSPQEKAQYIEQLKLKSKKILMAGDGINDSVALSLCDVAISMGSGSQIATGVSDAVILDDNLSKIVFAIKTARQTFITIRQNLAFSLLYNMFTIPLAMAGYVIPLIAALSMSLSSLVVVGNSLRMKKEK